MNSKCIILVLGLLLAVCLVSATECWEYTTQAACTNDTSCRWDFFGRTCHEINCWDFGNEENCNDANDLGIACQWQTQSSSGWCEKGTECWNYQTNASCSVIDGCRWDGTSICKEIQCWDYTNRITCEAHAANGCSWDGWGCKETAGCFSYFSNSACEAVEGCMWRSNAYCAQEGCWNYNDEASCNEHNTDGCLWQMDQWSGRSYCMEAENCWSQNTEAGCTNIGCYWNSDDNECLMKDCFVFSGTDNNTCTNNDLDLNCKWQAQCQPDGPGGTNCWQYTDSDSCGNAVGCIWGQCMNRGCWDYTNQVECEAVSGCNWGGYNCMQEGCPDARTESACADMDNCVWLSDQGWCEEEKCWNYQNNISCLSQTDSVNCEWRVDQYNPNGNCAELGCWNYQNSTSCEAADCIWNSNGLPFCECTLPNCLVMCSNYDSNETTCNEHAADGCQWKIPGWCNQKGCWNYNTNATCSADSNCEWDSSGQCYVAGCWDYKNEDDCTGNDCTWGGSGWCSQQGCWNYKTKLACDNNTQCKWNDENNYCSEINCWDFTTQINCEMYNSSLGCKWDGWNCIKEGCWSYYDNSTKCEDNSCTWTSQGTCKTRDCWNYKTNETCSADTNCNWNAYCTGDYLFSCWNYADEASCVSGNCSWQGNCYKKGCWSYQTRQACCGTSDCTSSNDCGWQSSGYCKETGCWDYLNEAACLNASSLGCTWDSQYNYCYRTSCYSYTNSSACTQAPMDCVWDSQNNYCYEDGCWNYNTKAQCETQNVSGCKWNAESNYCYKEGCWSYTSSITCDAQTNCDWVDSGWCYQLGCWNYNTESTCTPHAACKWDSTFSYCSEKGCWEYTNSTDCNSTKKCAWNDQGSYCYEKGCWNIYDNTTCSADANCYWDANSGWCGEGGCWDYKTNATCSGDASGYGDCAWDSVWNNCYERGCWAKTNETGCTNDTSCFWETGSGGWCYQESCWDNKDQASCIAMAGCAWNSDFEYCYEVGCWQYTNSSDCGNNSCTWKTSSWGWCEQKTCGSYYNNETGCTDANDGIDCVWNSPRCDDVACWAFDGQGQVACEQTSLAQYGLNCTYEDSYCEPAAGFCRQYDNKKKDCMDTHYCFYDFMTNECREPVGAAFASDMAEFNPECWLFDVDSVSCNNVSICTYDGDSCENKAGSENMPVKCENITSMDLCNSIPALSTCCRWRNNTCKADFTDDKCRKNLQDPPEGAKFCEDYNSYTSEQLCNQIAGSPWFMPCSWDGTNCVFKFNDVVGASGDYTDIKTEELCKKAKGEWLCEEYCEDNNTIDNSDDQLKSECWCTVGSGIGKEICAKSCWACEYQNNGTAWSNLQQATDACESSLANCEFEADSLAENGYGSCDFSAEMAASGGCDSSCAACNDVVDNPQTKEPETKISCLKSKAQCKWYTNLANKSIGKCIDKSEQTCSENCFKCTQSECAAYGLGEAGKCTYDSAQKLCKPSTLLNEEICSNGNIDDNNNGLADCDDPACIFAPECGQAGTMHQCWKYNHNATLCNSSLTIAGSSMNCTWIQDPSGGQWCGHPSEVCWRYDRNQNSCNNQRGACKYKETGGKCDINKTKAETCFGKSQVGCAGDCEWVTDILNPKGGRCEFKMFSICHDAEITTQSGCTNGDNEQYCGWVFDPNSANGGRCEPKCFNLNNVSCNTNAKCEWILGMCEPNVTTSENCYANDNTDRATCEASPACSWSPAKMGGECEPDFEGDYVNNKDCMDLYRDQASCNADVACVWMSDDFAGKGTCENKAFACPMIAKRAFKQGQNATAACNQASNYSCTWVANQNSPMGGECESVCSTLDNCADDANCKSFTGWCDPKGQAMMFQKMGSPPAPLAGDDCNETGKVSYLDICGLGVKDDFDVFGIGITVADMSEAAICNGEYITNHQTGQSTQGSGEEPLKVEFYMDSDGQAAGGCSASNSAELGFEYKLVLESTTSETDKISKYKCTNSEWKVSAIEAFTMPNMVCSEVGGPLVAIGKGTLAQAGGFDLQYTMRIYVITINSTSGSAVDALLGRYTPGSIDTKLEDCFGFVDKDGDGLTPDKDPDCKFIKKKGGMVFEDCFAPGDEDQDGLTNCDDPDCKMMPICGGQLFDFTVENDTTSASITRYEVDSFPDSAFVKYDTSEPANGTLLFYRNDSTCRTVNATIYDIGITDPNIPPYKLWHDGHIDINSLGYALEISTAYYFKLRVCDKAGNPCGESACLNFTTKASLAACGVKCQPVFDVKYVPPDDDDQLSDTEVQWDFGDGYANKPCGGQGSFKKSYNETKNMNMKLENENATDPWSLEFMNMTAAGTVNTNKTTLESDELIANTTDDGISYVGMDHDAWADLKYELNPKEVKICVPGDVDTLYYCANESAVSVDECLNVTGQVTSGPTYNSGLDCTEFTVPADLGFSVYFGKSGGGDGGSSSSSSGSGGGGAGGGGATSRYIATASWAGMQKGIRTMSISSKYIPFTKLEIDVKAPVTGEASITVKMLNESEKPTVELLPGKVHSYLKITTTKITDENINNVKIKFKLPQSWFDKNSLGLDNIALYRYAGKWAPLPTKRIDYINETAYYEATTPGFSYFGIAEKQAVKQEEPEQPLVTTDEGTEQETPSPEQQPGTEEAKERAKQNILPPVLYAIIAVVLVGGIIFLISRKKQRSSK